MHTHLHRRGRTGPRLALLAVLCAGLGTGCQSTRPGYLFQPIRTSTAAVAPPAEQANAAPPQAAGATVSAAVVVATPAPQRQQRPSPATRLQMLASERRTAAVPPHRVAKASVPRLVLALRHRPQAPAEAGLGTTVLGLLGLVALPVALIGLALSGGGLVWAIVAGVAALAVLVALIDPDGR